VFSQNRARLFIFTSVPCDLFLARLRNSFGLAETSLHGNLRLVLARPRSSFGLAESSLLNDYFLYQRKYKIALSLPLGQPRLVLARPRNSSLNVKDLVIKSLRANRDVLTSQHMHSHGLPKDKIEATSKIYLSLIDF
jgi:hypothetical protein